MVDLFGPKWIANGPMFPMTVPRKLSVSSHMQQMVIGIDLSLAAASAKHMQ